MAVKVPMVKLNNGLMMPQLGLGVWQAREGREVEQAVAMALECGYRLIDTAKIYGNEAGVGRAVRSSGLDRAEVFVTTKLWNSDQGYDSALRGFDASLDRLGLDYVDLYLIHWPVPEAGLYMETWKALEQIYSEKRARAIGVSNFEPEQLEALRAEAKVVPAVNQIELHPRHPQRATRDYCSEHNIQVESYSPIMRGGSALNDATVKRIAAAHSKSAAQVILRWHMQLGLVAIPKSVHAERIRENIDIFDFELTANEMQQIDGLATEAVENM